MTSQSLAAYLDGWRMEPRPTDDSDHSHLIELSRRVLCEPDVHQAATDVTRMILEGNRTPWIEGYDFPSKANPYYVISWIAAGGTNPVEAFARLSRRLEGQEHRCQEVWNGEHVAYRCYTCGISSNSCMCVFCFDAADHEGHDYRLYKSNAGGCCDCGDPLAWKESGFCKRHRVSNEPKPSILSPEMAKGARIAIRAAVQHILWAARRCFFHGKLRPEVSGGFGIGMSIKWLDDMVGVCPEFCQIIGHALNERRDVYSDTMGWGNFCPAFSDELVADETATKSLVRLACFLPYPLAESLSNLFLKVLLDADFKMGFTNAFVSTSDDILALLGAENPESTFHVPKAKSGEGKEERVDEDEGVAEYWPLDQPPKYKAPRMGSVLTAKALSHNAKRFLDRIYCQLMHSETVALPYAPELLMSALTRLNTHFQACKGDDGMLVVTRTSSSFHRRIFSQLDLLFQHDSVCHIVFRNEDMFRLVLEIIACGEFLALQRRRAPSENHIELPDPEIQPAFNLFFAIEENLIDPLVRSVKSLIASNQNSMESRIRDTWRRLEKWTSDHAAILIQLDLCSLHATLTRFLWRLIDLAKPTIDFFSSLFTDGNLNSVVQLITTSIRVINMTFEVQDNLWVRNGQHTMFNLTFWYLKIFSRGTLEADLQVLRGPLIAFPDESFLFDSMFEEFEKYTTLPNALRLSGAIALQGSGPTSMKRCVIHCLAYRDCSFSQLDQLCPSSDSKSLKDLERVLEEVADFHDASVHPGGTPAHYSLKPAYWDEIEFGGMFLRLMKSDEESALSRYKRVKGIENGSFLPIPRFPLTDPVCRAVLSSIALRGACLEVLTGIAGEEAKTTACLLIIGALELQASLMSSSTGSDESGRESVVPLFPKQTFLDLMTHNPDLFQTTPPNVLARLRALLTSSDQQSPSQPGSPASFVSVSPAKDITKVSRATKAQQKAMKAFAKKQREFQMPVDEEDGATERASKKEKATPDDDGDGDVCALCRKDASSETLSMLVLKERSSFMWNRESVALEGEGRCVALVRPTSQTATPTVVTSTRTPPLPDGIASIEPEYMQEASVLRCVSTIRCLRRDQFSDGKPRPMFSSQERAVALVHTCGHCVHSSCLKQYRRVLQESALARQPFEGMGVVRLDKSELFCPVCRRVMNDLVPLIPKSFSPTQAESAKMFKPLNEPEWTGDAGAYNAQFIHERDLTTAVESGLSKPLGWVRTRFLEYSSAIIPSPSDEFIIDRFCSSVRSFFENCASLRAIDGNMTGGDDLTPQELISHQLHVSPEPTLDKATGIMLELAMRQMYLAADLLDELESEIPQRELMINEWGKFVKRFLGSYRSDDCILKSGVNQDLTAAFVSWITLWPFLRCARRDSPIVLQEARRALAFLLPFAVLQDALIQASIALAKQAGGSFETQFGNPANQQDSTNNRLVSLLDGIAFSKSSRNSIDEVDQSLMTASGVAALVTLENLKPEAAQAIMDLYVQAGVDAELLPFLPALSSDELESKEEVLKRHATMLFGEAVLDLPPLTADDKSALTSCLAMAIREHFRYVKSLQTFPDVTSVERRRLAVKFLMTASMPRLLPRRRTPFVNLVRLPQNFASFTVGYIARGAICRNCKEPPKQPVVCLSCGTLLCNQTECCASGDAHEVLKHGEICPRGLGIYTGTYLFLDSGLVILLLDGSRTCAWGALYLDKHEEEDRNLTRGRPLTLNMDRLAALERTHETQSWLLQTRVLDYVRIF